MTENQINVTILEKIIDRLSVIVSGHMVDMMQSYIHHELSNYCGTPGCHGGWLGIAMGTTAVEYDVAIHEFALKIGFNNQEALKCWAHNNPTIWGNECGYYMFISSTAFDQLTNTFSAQVLVDHWRGVISRLKASQ